MVAVVLVGCGTQHTVPITGRTQTLMVEDGQVLGLATQQYQEFMKTAKLSTNAANTAMVKRVGQNLANAVTSYMNANGLGSELANFKWTFNLVQNKEANAWCMPGGLIVVYEGILPITQDESSLAIVMGHEIAHAVARHSAEQMSTQMKQQQGLQIGAAVAGMLGMGTNTTSLISAVVANGFNLHHLRVPERPPLRCHAYQSDPGLAPRGTEVLQEARCHHRDEVCHHRQESHHNQQQRAGEDAENLVEEEITRRKHSNHRKEGRRVSTLFFGVYVFLTHIVIIYDRFFLILHSVLLIRILTQLLL